MHQHGDSQIVINWKVGMFQHGVQYILKRLGRTEQVENKRRNSKPKIISTADEQYLKVVSLINMKKSSKDMTQDPMDTSGPSTVY